MNFDGVSAGDRPEFWHEACADTFIGVDANYIRDRRLERCRLRLLDPRFAHQTVSELAFQAGFGDLSGFNRAFKAKYGLSPRQLRSAVGSVAGSRS